VTRGRAGVLLAIAQVALVSSLGLKLMVDRARLPRGWARTVPYDPSLPIRGRYVRLALEVPLAGARDDSTGPGALMVRLRSVGGRLEGKVVQDAEGRGVQVNRNTGEPHVPVLAAPVAFYIPESVPDPSRRPAGEELWAEVTIPAAGAPRPIRLGVMRDGQLTPLELR
jgi:hypothetical protein